MKNKWPLFLICIVAFSFISQITQTQITVAQENQENQVTAIRPGGTYHVYVNVKKPAGMVLSQNWEIRFYFYDGENCYNTAPSGEQDGWWNSSGDTWRYTGFFDHSVKNQSWSSPDEKIWSQEVPVIHYPAQSGMHEARYPPPVGENYENKMDEIPVGGTVNVMARFLLGNLSNVSFDTANQVVTFNYGGKIYNNLYTPYLDDFELYEIGATLSQSEDVGEWSLAFDQTMQIRVDNNAPATGTIYMPTTIEIDLSTIIIEHFWIPPLLVILSTIILVSVGIVLTIVYTAGWIKKKFFVMSIIILLIVGMIVGMTYIKWGGLPGV